MFVTRQLRFALAETAFNSDKGQFRFDALNTRKDHENFRGSFHPPNLKGGPKCHVNRRHKQASVRTIHRARIRDCNSQFCLSFGRFPIASLDLYNFTNWLNICGNGPRLSSQKVIPLSDFLRASVRRVVSPKVSDDISNLGFVLWQLFCLVTQV